MLAYLEADVREWQLLADTGPRAGGLLVRAPRTRAQLCRAYLPFGFDAAAAVSVFKAVSNLIDEGPECGRSGAAMIKSPCETQLVDDAHAPP